MNVCWTFLINVYLTEIYITASSTTVSVDPKPITEVATPPRWDSTIVDISQRLKSIRNPPEELKTPDSKSLAVSESGYGSSENERAQRRLHEAKPSRLNIKRESGVKGKEIEFVDVNRTPLTPYNRNNSLSLAKDVFYTPKSSQIEVDDHEVRRKLTRIPAGYPISQLFYTPTGKYFASQISTDSNLCRHSTCWWSSCLPRDWSFRYRTSTLV